MQYRFWKETRVALLQNSPGQLSWLWIGCASPTCLGMFVEFHALNAFHASGLIPWIAVGGAFVVVDIDVEVVVLLVDVAVWHLSWFSRGILTGWQYWESVFPWNTTISNRNRKSFLHELKHPWAPSPCLVSCDSKIQLYSHHLRPIVDSTYHQKHKGLDFLFDRLPKPWSVCFLVQLVSYQYSNRNRASTVRSTNYRDSYLLVGNFQGWITKLRGSLSQIIIQVDIFKAIEIIE